MASQNDHWYIRFPDGQVLRAVGTSVVREKILAGKLPTTIRLRRTMTEEWRSLDRFPEFADLHLGSSTNGVKPRSGVIDRLESTPTHPTSIASRLDPTQLDMLGVGSYLEELLAALDSTLTQRKLFISVVIGLLLGICLGLNWALTLLTPHSMAQWGWILPGVAFFAFCWLQGVIARMTFYELSRLRPSRLRHVLPGSFVMMLRLVVVEGVVVAVIGGGIYAMRHLPGWCAEMMPSDQPYVAMLHAVSGGVSVLAEIFLWPLFLLTAPLAPILVVEQSTLFGCIKQWYQLVNRSGFRVILAHSFALSLAGVLALPLVGLMWLVRTRGADPTIDLVVQGTQLIIAGALFALPMAYLLVSSVFIYLRLNYEKAGR